MREIKCRGMTIKGEFIVGNLLYMNDKTYINESYYGDLDDVDFGWGFQEISKKTMGQYTGLKDKNGVEIYEGDIVKYLTRAVSHLDGIIWHGRVMYQYGAFRLCRNLHNDAHSEGMGYGLPYEYEVIGNIYENPELLEATK